MINVSIYHIIMVSIILISFTILIISAGFTGQM